MSAFINKHVFTAELPYEKDAAVTDYLRNHFTKVDNFIMSLGQMSSVPPSTLDVYINGKKEKGCEGEERKKARKGP